MSALRGAMRAGSRLAAGLAIGGVVFSALLPSPAVAAPAGVMLLPAAKEGKTSRWLALKARADVAGLTPGRWSRNIEGITGGLSAIHDSQTGTALQLTNLHGDIVATASLSTTATGPTATFEADEFGNPRAPSTRRYGWLGGELRRTELASGVIQMGRRSYVPSMGRFTSVDPITNGSANAYEYGYQDPVNNVDLTGCQGVFRCLMNCVSAYCNFNRVIRSCSEAIGAGSLRQVGACIIDACAAAGTCVVQCLPKKKKRRGRRRPPGGGGGDGGGEILPLTP